MGFQIPAMPAPDLSVANLIGQVIENREIVSDETTTPILETPSLNASIPVPSASTTDSPSPRSQSQSHSDQGSDNVDARIQVHPEMRGKNCSLTNRKNIILCLSNSKENLCLS